VNEFAVMPRVERIRQVTDDPAGMLRAKADFYEVLFEGSGNPELRQMLDGLIRRATLVRVTSLSVEGRPAQAAREMQAILEAARARDADETARRCAAHVRAAAEAALGYVAHRLDDTGE
jgi:DNA-binding GntR family transcriptional regulator